MSLSFLLPVFANALPSQYIALFLLFLAYILQPHNRTNLVLPFGWFMFGLVVIPTFGQALQSRFLATVFLGEPPEFFNIKLLTGWPSPTWANLPGIVQLQVLLTLSEGLYLIFRSTGTPQAVNGMIWENGTLWITSTSRSEKLCGREDIRHIHTRKAH